MSRMHNICDICNSSYTFRDAVRSIQKAKWLTLPTSDDWVTGLNPTGGKRASRSMSVIAVGISGNFRQYQTMQEEEI